MGEPEEEITQEEFIERFVKRMLRDGATFDDGSPIEEYAREAAKIAWDESDLRGEGPEACAEAEMEYWGEG